VIAKTLGTLFLIAFIYVIFAIARHNEKE